MECFIYIILVYIKYTTCELEDQAKLGVSE